MLKVFKNIFQRRHFYQNNPYAGSTLPSEITLACEALRQGLPKSEELETTWLRYPLQIENREEFNAAVGRYHQPSNWFECAAHGYDQEMAELGYRTGSCPVAERATQTVATLLTHQRLVGLDTVTQALSRMRRVDKHTFRYVP